MQPEHSRDGGGDEQQDDERILELPYKLLPGGNGFFGRYFVPAVEFEALPDLVRTQASPGICPLTSQHFINGLSPGSRRIRLIHFAHTHSVRS